MRVSLHLMTLGAAMFALAASASAQQIAVHERVFNDDADSVLLTIVGADNVSFVDTKLDGDGVGGEFANRHDWRISDDSVTDKQFGVTDYFTLATTLVLTGDPVSPRKEAGLRLNNSAGDGLFIVNTDAHEVVAFGGALPYYSFGNTYNSGNVITLSMQYLNQAGVNGIIYTANGVSSPFLPMTNLEQGVIAGSTLGGYGQFNIAPGNPLNTGSATFRSITFNGAPTTGAIPEPGTMALLGMGALPLLRRRRK